ncbi:MAG: hypothetical protein IK062_00170 [Selenomonadaceae bacterium]|nr:hypothetical protein [Selenomonadaceae bacterium]
MDTKRIIILEKNAKNNNFCIAGLTENGEWIRPISNNPEIEDAVPRESITFPDESELQLLDVVEVPIMENNPVNNPIQPENFYYDDKIFWKKVGHMTLNKVTNLHGFDNRSKIFYNYDRSVDAEFVRRQPKRESLLLLPIKNLSVSVEIYNDHKKFFANFNYNGKNYQRFSVGDISVRERFKNFEEGEHFFKNRAVVLFSLTNPYKDGRCYKMVAQVF